MTHRPQGFSLIELVTVIVIISVVALIAIPRLSDFATGAQAAATDQNIALLSSAVERYRAEHNLLNPASAQHLLRYTDESGRLSNLQTPTHPLGPYLQTIPPVPKGPGQGSRSLAVDGQPGSAIAGYLIDPSTGRVRLNAAFDQALGGGSGPLTDGLDLDLIVDPGTLIGPGSF